MKSVVAFGEAATVRIKQSSATELLEKLFQATLVYSGETFGRADKQTQHTQPQHEHPYSFVRTYIEAAATYGTRMFLKSRHYNTILAPKIYWYD